MKILFIILKILVIIYMQTSSFATISRPKGFNLQWTYIFGLLNKLFLDLMSLILQTLKDKKINQEDLACRYEIIINCDLAK